MSELKNKRAAIFLNGSYPVEGHGFYRKRMEEARSDGLLVAVDGALRLFDHLKVEPHLMLGDFDSADTQLLKEFSDIETQKYPSEKDFTDGELALRYLLDHGYEQIDIYGAIDTDFETDQMLANIFNLAIANDYARAAEDRISVRLVDHCQYIYLIEDSTLEIAGRRDDVFSILPITRQAVLTVSGAKWPLTEETI
jgi:thiamine pyrophosphokinase